MWDEHTKKKENIFYIYIYIYMAGQIVEIFPVLDSPNFKAFADDY